MIERGSAIAGPRWAYAWRILPRGQVVTLLGLASAFGLGTQLVGHLDRTVFWIVATTGLTTATVTTSAAVEDAAATPRWRRCLMAITITAGMVATGAAAAWTMVLAFRPDSAWPGWWAVAEGSVIGVSQLAVGAVVAARRPANTNFVPGIVTGVVWLVLLQLPRTTRWFEPTSDRWPTWSGIASIGLLVTAGAITDLRYRVVGLRSAFLMRWQ